MGIEMHVIQCFHLHLEFSQTEPFLGKFGGTVCARGFVLVVSSVGHLALVLQNFYASMFCQACI